MTYLEDILNEHEFEAKRFELQKLLASDDSIYEKFMDIFVELMKYQYVSSKNWMGIPIVKLPEDIVVLQEFYFEYKPTAVIEIGVARGGSVSLAISLQKLNEIKPNVLGIDIKIFPHAHKSLNQFVENGFLNLLEASSVSDTSEKEIENFVTNHEKIFVILDSNHSHQHVFEELQMMDRVLPKGSVILVADGIIEHLPEREDRPWGKGNSPLTAVSEFLEKNPQWKRLEKYSRRSIFSEFRDGWIVKI